VPYYVNPFYETYKKDEYSQNGEDGVIAELLRRLGLTTGWVCEFGAWDGRTHSNTFILVESGFHAVYIEGDPQKYADLTRTAAQFPGIVPICRLVDYQDNENCLDRILAGTPIPTDPALLSIDVDSCDYHIWKSTLRYAPAIVVIEIESSVFPTDMDHIHTLNRSLRKEDCLQTRDDNPAPPGTEYWMTGFGPMLTLGMEKGYTFICHTGNMLFVRNDLAHRLDLSDLADNPLKRFRRKWMSLGNRNRLSRML
jgi:hypothetical protein